MPTTVREVSDALCQRGRIGVEKSLARGIEKGKVTPEARDALVASADGDGRFVLNQAETLFDVELDAPLDPKLANRPLEPGSGAPDLGASRQKPEHVALVPHLDVEPRPPRHLEAVADADVDVVAGHPLPEAAAAAVLLGQAGGDLQAAPAIALHQPPQGLPVELHGCLRV